MRHNSTRTEALALRMCSQTFSYTLIPSGCSSFGGGLAAQLCLTLCDPMDCSPPGSSVHRILQACILEWIAISFSRGSSSHRH